jgi:hypothetical protein
MLLSDNTLNQLLKYFYYDVETYEGLTTREKEIITPEQFKTIRDTITNKETDQLKTKIKLDKPSENRGGGLVGYVDMSHENLVSTFGKYSVPTDEYKTDYEVYFELDGVVISLYNYKDGINYNGEDGTPTEDITEWHIGSDDVKAVTILKEYLSQEKIEHDDIRSLR